MRNILTVLVALAIAGLFLLTLAWAPPFAPAATIGTLPLGTGHFAPGLSGTYYAPCAGGTLPIRWAAFLWQSNEPNVTFHLAGAWDATRPTDVSFGFSVNVSPTAVLRDWMPVAHCPLMPVPPPPPSSPPTPPPLPTSGRVDYNITTLPDATLFLLVFRTFDSADVITVTEPFTAIPA